MNIRPKRRSGPWDDPWDRPPRRAAAQTDDLWKERFAPRPDPQPEPEEPEEELEDEEENGPEEAPRSRRGLKIALILVPVVLALTAVGVAGGLLLRNITVSGEITIKEPDSPSETTYYLPTQPVEADPEPTCYLEQAPLGDGTTLDVVTSAGLTELSYEDIYARNIDSVVSLVCFLNDGAYTTGTGVIFSQDGYIVTNEHVIEDAMEVSVTLQNGDFYYAQFIGMDAQTDLAVLKISASGLTPAQFSNSDEIVVGNGVVAIGNPLGTTFTGTMTTGIISAINRNVQVNGSYMNLIQTDCAINPGNSGGPLINRFGQVIGICNMKMISSADQTAVEGIGFAIPANTVSNIVTKLIAKGEVVRAMLGITAYDMDKSECMQHGITGGIMVVTVSGASDAFAQGIRVGDIITAVDGIPVSAVDALNTYKADMSPGDQIVLTVLRDKEYTDYTVTLMHQKDVE